MNGSRIAAGVGSGFTLGRVLLAASALMALAACSPIQPWVKPYEREHLADPVMALDPNPVSSDYLQHVFGVREASRGATGAVGGGCGCN